MEVAVKPRGHEAEATHDGTGTEADRLRNFGATTRGVEISDATKEAIGHDAWRQFTERAGSFCGEVQSLTPDSPVEDLETIRAWRENASALLASTDAMLALAYERDGGVASSQ